MPEGCMGLVPGEFIPWDNLDNLVSAETELLVDRVKAVNVLPLLCVIGVPSNVINVAVFAKQGAEHGALRGVTASEVC